jgi:hypothetical protein
MGWEAGELEAPVGAALLRYFLSDRESPPPAARQRIVKLLLLSAACLPVAALAASQKATQPPQWREGPTPGSPGISRANLNG